MIVETCAWRNDSGLPCRYPGSFSFSTKGTGPWYCRWHVNPGSVDEAARIVLESQSYILEDRLSERRQQQRQADAYVSSLGLARKEAEPATVYRARRSAWVKARMVALGRGVWEPPEDDPDDSAVVLEMKKILRARHRGELAAA